jgi:hypothetical protein
MNTLNLTDISLSTTSFAHGRREKSSQSLDSFQTLRDEKNRRFVLLAGGAN